MELSDEKKPRERKKPRKVTPRSLENVALAYLRRYSASTASLKRVLLRRADRSLKFHGGDRVQALGWIDELVERLTRAGLLNDEAFAKNRVSSLRRRGASARGVRFKLAAKGVAKSLVEASLDTSAEAELEAAEAYARRRKLGPFQPNEAKRKERREKDLAAIVRQGFSFGIAKKVLEGKR